MVKNKTGVATEHLLAALRSLPDDNNLTSVKGMIRHALTEIEHVEKKKSRWIGTQKRIADEWQAKLEANVTKNPAMAQRVLDQLNKMIETEQQKTKKVQEVPTQIETLLG
jgi:hypothetical protein